MWHKKNNNTINITCINYHEPKSNENAKNKNNTSIYKLSNNSYCKTSESKSVKLKEDGINNENHQEKEEL
jgi:hypothetical protein